MIYFKYHDCSFAQYACLYFCLFSSFTFKLPLFHKLFSKDCPAVLCSLIYLYNCSYKDGVLLCCAGWLWTQAQGTLLLSCPSSWDYRYAPRTSGSGDHASDFCLILRMSFYVFDFSLLLRLIFTLSSLGLFYVALDFWTLMCRSAWPQTHRAPPISASECWN